MPKSRKGSAYLEVLISLVIILLLLNPLFSSLIFLRKNLNRVKDYNILENEIEKVRAFYKKNNTEIKYISKDSSLEIEIKTKKIYEEVYSLEITISKGNLKRESVLYVYEQK
ncbi:MAG: hypothetical protein ACRC4Y_06595 [Cetobacterium sp.]